MRPETFYHDLLLDASTRFPAYPEGRYRGRGIVLCAGGLSHLSNAYVCLRFLRERTSLPIELFHAGAPEMPAKVRTLLEQDFAPLAVRDIGDAADPIFPVRSFHGFHIKPFAILRSGFEEVFYVDADNMPLQGLEPLFASAEYRRTGALFWPDLEDMKTTSPELFRAFGVTPDSVAARFELESGQMVLDKRRCWKALLTVCLANSDAEGFRDFCYGLALGDKDTFRLGFEFAGQPYSVVPHPPRKVGIPFLFVPLPLTERRLWIQHDLGAFLDTGLLQHDLAGTPLFVHKTICPWDVYLDYRYLRDMEGPDRGIRPLPALAEWDERGRGYLEEFRSRYLDAFGRNPAKELQRLAAKGITRALDGLLYVRRLRDRPPP
jgi:hypothetical protein